MLDLYLNKQTTLNKMFWFYSHRDATQIIPVCAHNSDSGMCHYDFCGMAKRDISKYDEIIPDNKFHKLRAVHNFSCPQSQRSHGGASNGGSNKNEGDSSRVHTLKRTFAFKKSEGESEDAQDTSINFSPPQGAKSACMISPPMISGLRNMDDGPHYNTDNDTYSDVGDRYGYSSQSESEESQDGDDQEESSDSSSSSHPEEDHVSVHSEVESNTTPAHSETDESSDSESSVHTVVEEIPPPVVQEASPSDYMPRENRDAVATQFFVLTDIDVMMQVAINKMAEARIGPIEKSLKKLHKKVDVDHGTALLSHSNDLAVRRLEQEVENLHEDVKRLLAWKTSREEKKGRTSRFPEGVNTGKPARQPRETHDGYDASPFPPHSGLAQMESLDGDSLKETDGRPGIETINVGVTPTDMMKIGSEGVKMDTGKQELAIPPEAMTRIAQFEWRVDQARGLVIKRLHFPEDLFNANPWTKKDYEQFQYFSCDGINLRITSTSVLAQGGDLGVAWDPMSISYNCGVNDMVRLSSLAGCSISAGDSVVKDIFVPFISFQNKLSLAGIRADVVSMGSLVFFPLNGLVAPAETSDKIVISVYAAFKNPRFQVQTVTHTYGDTAPQRAQAQVETLGASSSIEPVSLSTRDICHVSSWWVADQGRLVSLNCHPTMLSKDLEGTGLILPSLARLSSLFSFWRGSLKYKFVFGTSALMKGKVKFVSLPETYIFQNPTLDWLNLLPGTVYDLSYPQKSIEIEVPFNCVTDYFRTHTEYTLDANFHGEQILTRLHMFVVDPLMANVGSVSKIDYYVEVSPGSDFRVKVPTGLRFGHPVTYTPQFLGGDCADVGKGILVDGGKYISADYGYLFTADLQNKGAISFPVGPYLQSQSEATNPLAWLSAMFGRWKGSLEYELKAMTHIHYLEKKIYVWHQPQNYDRTEDITKELLFRPPSGMKTICWSPRERETLSFTVPYASVYESLYVPRSEFTVTLSERLTHNGRVFVSFMGTTKDIVSLQCRIKPGPDFELFDRGPLGVMAKDGELKMKFGTKKGLMSIVDTPVNRRNTKMAMPWPVVSLDGKSKITDSLNGNMGMFDDQWQKIRKEWLEFGGPKPKALTGERQMAWNPLESMAKAFVGESNIQALREVDIAGTSDNLNNLSKQFEKLIPMMLKIEPAIEAAGRMVPGMLESSAEATPQIMKGLADMSQISSWLMDILKYLLRGNFLGYSMVLETEGKYTGAVFITVTGLIALVWWYRKMDNKSLMQRIMGLIGIIWAPLLGIKMLQFLLWLNDRGTQVFIDCLDGLKKLFAKQDEEQNQHSAAGSGEAQMAFSIKEFIPSLESVIGPILASSIGLVSLLCLHRLPTDKESKSWEQTTKQWGEKCRSLNSITSTLGYLQKFSEWLSGAILGFVGKILGRKYVESDSILSRAVELKIGDWIRDVGEMSLEENLHFGITNKDKINEIRALHDIGEKIKQHLVGPEGTFVPPGAMLIIKEAMTNCKKLMDEVYRCKGLGTKRVDPYHISLYGLPGVGKSAVMEKMIMDILDHRKYAKVDRLYARSTGDAYWSGYNHQPAVLYDDLGALIAKNDVSDLGEIIKLKSNSPVPLPMAAVEEKGKMFMSDFLISSTNMTTLDNQTDIRFPDAFYRRRNYYVEVVREPNVAKNPEDVTDGLWFRKLNPRTAFAEGHLMQYKDFLEVLKADVDKYMEDQHKLLAQDKARQEKQEEDPLKSVAEDLDVEIATRTVIDEPECSYAGVAQMDGDKVSFVELLEKYSKMGTTGACLSKILHFSMDGFYEERLEQCGESDFESHVRALCESDPARASSSLAVCCWRLYDSIRATKRNFFYECGLAPQYSAGVEFVIVDQSKFDLVSVFQLFGLLVQVLNQVKKTGELCPLAQYIHQIDMRQVELLQEAEIFVDAQTSCVDFPSLDGLVREKGCRRLDWAAIPEVYPDIQSTCGGLVLKDHEEFIVVSPTQVEVNDAVAALTRQALLYGKRTRVAKEFSRYIPVDDLYVFKNSLEAFGYMDITGKYTLEQEELLKDLKEAYGDTGLYVLFLLMVFENTNVHFQRQKRADELVAKRLVMTKKLEKYKIIEKSWLEKMSWPMKIAMAIGAGFAALGTALGLGASLWGLAQWAFGIGIMKPKPKLTQEPWETYDEELETSSEDFLVQKEQGFGSGDEKTKYYTKQGKRALLKNTRVRNAIKQMSAESEMKDGHEYMTMQLTLLAQKAGATDEQLKNMYLDKLPDDILEGLEVQTAMPFTKVIQKFPQTQQCLFEGRQVVDGEKTLFCSEMGMVVIPRTVATILEALPEMECEDDGFCDNATIRREVSTLVKEGFVGPLKKTVRTRPTVRRELEVDKEADQMAKVLVRAGAQFFFPKYKTRAQVVRVFGGVVLLPIHYLLALDEGDEIYLVTTQNVTKIRFEQSNLILLNKNQDVVLYDCGPRVPIARDIREYFYTHQDLMHYVPGPGFLMNVCMSTKGPTVFQEFLREIDLVTHTRFPSGTYYDTGFGDHSMLNAMQYPVFSKSGYCGSMILRTNPRVPRKIVGIHVASNKSCVTGFAEIVCQEDLNRAFEMLTKQGKRPISGVANYEDMLVQKVTLVETNTTVTEETEFEVLPLKFEHEMGRVQRLGKVQPSLAPKVNCTSDIKKSPIHGFIGEVKTEPSILHNADRRLPKNLRRRWEPALDAASKYGQECTPFPKRKIEYVEQFLMEKLGTLDNSLKRRAVTSEQEAIDGIEGTDFWQPIDMDTSPGYPYIKHRRVSQKGKRFLFKENHPLPSGRRSYTVSDSFLRSELDNRLKNAQKGEMYKTVTMEAVKDERRKLKKIYENPATRTFTCLPLDLNLLVRRFFQDFGVMVMEMRHNLFCKVGMNPDSLEWTQMFYQWQGLSEFGFAGDYAKFDGIGPPEIYESIVRVINAWYGDSEEEQTVRRTLLMELFHRETMIEGDMYRIDQGLPSGFPQTVIFNSFVNYYFLAMAWVDIVGASDYSENHGTLEEFDRLTKVATYGDDNVVIVHEEIKDVYNLRTVAAWLAGHGITYTDDKKSPADQASPWVSLWDLTFLKRGFKTMDNRGLVIAAPLDKTAIEEQVHWIRKAPDEVAAVHQNVCNAVYEALAHGGDYYWDLRERVEKAYRCHMFDDKIPSFRQHMIRWWLSKVPLSSPLSIAEAVQNGSLAFECNLNVAAQKYGAIDPLMSELETYRVTNPAELVLTEA
ncbi:TPA_asm: polyprotein [Juglans nigra waikavirus]|uniref:Genome polyprotein n=1 Tax=Juglans nigra waikavirus TaxID=3027342 RepID=A0AA48PAV1_9SECO|nr:TPA_asm: polyprotein [Juglans nigra waikavirus]